MISLVNGMLLYHGSYAEVSDINLEKCSKGKDFGQGFYVTSSKEQAIKFIQLSCKRQICFGNIPENTKGGYVSVYKLHVKEKLSIEVFEGADQNWLHFVAANRDDKLFQKMIERYKNVDIIGGKIADDRTARTLLSYLDGLYGKPGTEQADQFAIQLLLPNRLEDQYCFRTKSAISALEFVGSEYYAYQ